MSDFGNYGGGSMESKKQQVMDQVRSELALANAQELINKINEKCFARCVPKPGPKLSGGEQVSILVRDLIVYQWRNNVIYRTVPIGSNPGFILTC
ncbi:protein translocase subunit, partial [Modicella reniformis]